MSRFRKAVVIILVVEILLIIAGNVLVLMSIRREDRLYRVETKRIARQLQSGPVSDIDLEDYRTIIRIVPYDGSLSNYDYITAECDGVLYRIEYETGISYLPLIAVDLCLAVMFLVTVGVMIYVDRKILRPFNTMTNMTIDLAKGNLTRPVREEKSRFFGKFLWGMDMLRENLEDSKRKELEYQKEKKTLVLSLSHDIKTPLSAIELYTRALQDGIYDSEEKKKDALEGILKNTDEIKRYAGEINKISREDFIDLNVNVGEVYLNEVMAGIEAYYRDKLSVIHTNLQIEDHADCILSCDAERLTEVLQNFMENAIKYGDGRYIKISFKEEEDYKLICVENSGNPPDDTDMQNIFDSFYRGKNAKDTSGSGLGLYICKHLMQKMDGDAYAEAGENTFTAVAVVKMA